jgi:epoxyqueuosine reductase QueG
MKGSGMFEEKELLREKTREEQLLEEIENFAYKEKIDVIGVGDTANWESPQKEANPNKILNGCKRVIVLGKEIPPAIFTAKLHREEYYHQVATNYYVLMDNLSTEIALMLTRAGYPSIPLQGQSPTIVRRGQFWGTVSLKHSAVRAGLGVMGKSTVVLNEQYGNRLRFSGLITTSPLPAAKPLERTLCPPKCNACVDVCPVNALDGNGNVHQYRCMRNSTNSPLIGSLFLFQWLKCFKKVNEKLELVGNTIGGIYIYTCHECITACPYFKKGHT